MTHQPRRPLDLARLIASGVQLIEASAGTGKTYTITSLVLKLVAEHGFTVDQILAVTFTNAATAELRERIAERLSAARSALEHGMRPAGDEVIAQLLMHPDRALLLSRLEVACRDADRVSAFTIHGFAARILKEFPLETGARPDAELSADQRGLIVDIVTDFWVSQVASLPQQEFVAIGGAKFLEHLQSVARLVAGAFDVPRVTTRQGVALSDEIARFEPHYRAAQAAFLQQGPSLLDLLVSSKAINHSKLRVVSIKRDYAACEQYLASDDPGEPAPDFSRLTLSRVRESINKNRVAPVHPLLQVLDDLLVAAHEVQAAANLLKDELSARLADTVQSRLSAEHKRVGSQSFDNLLTDLCSALRNPSLGAGLAEALRQRFPVALIDEFQDTDLVQYEIFSKIYIEDTARSRAGLYLIGDPKQSIYAFRGADVFTYLAAGASVTAPISTLTTSYRSSPHLVAALNHLFGTCPVPFGLSEIVYDHISPRPNSSNQLIEQTLTPAPGLRLVYCDEGNTEWLETAAQEIVALLGSGMTLEGRAVRPSDIAVLTRTNREASELQRALRRLNIPAVMHGDRSVFESDEAAELKEIMLALSAPKKKGALRSALATQIFGLDAAQIAQLDHDVAELERWAAAFESFAELWRARSFAHCIEAIFAELSVVSRTLKERNGERRLTNLRHLVELMQEAQATQHLGMFGLIRFIEEATSDPTNMSMAPEARQLRLESDDRAIVLTTAHKSKGLEYNIVVLPVLGKPDSSREPSSYRFHDPVRGKSLLEIRVGKQDTYPLHERAELQEGLRLAYVALTRAKHQVVTFIGPSQRYSALGYLLFSRLLDGALDPLSFKDRQKELKNVDLRAQLERWAEGQPIEIAAPRWSTQSEVRRPFSSRILSEPPPFGRIAEQESTSSFSAMTRTQHLSAKSRQGRAQVDQDAVLGVGEADERARALGRCILADFPRGPRPGEALHSILEHCGFAPEQSAERREVALGELRRSGIAETHLETVHQSIEHVLQAPLSVHGSEYTFCLAQIAESDKYSEMEFNLLAGSSASSGPLGQRVSAQRLAAALLDLPPHYARTVSALRFEAFSGFVRGFMDLVCQREGRLFVLDYKSNYLGENYAEYGQNALQAAMEEHHYLLQSMLYSVALHQYAQVRIKDYSYDKHFGGTHYLFLRGLHPSLPHHGIYSLRPSLEAIERVGRVLGQASGSWEGVGA